jgi:hypothetical protein
VAFEANCRVFRLAIKTNTDVSGSRRWDPSFIIFLPKTLLCSASTPSQHMRRRNSGFRLHVDLSNEHAEYLR